MKSLLCAMLALSLAGPASAEPTPQTSTQGSSSATLDRLVAPIALYPDQLLAQMLVCATNPSKTAVLAEWLRSAGSLSGSELQDAATAAGFDPSFVALAVFPDIVSMLASDMEWTSALGQAFAADRSAVFGSIQRLRAQARSAGTLKSTPQQTVDNRTTSSGQQVIVIEPVNPQVVYVPQYNPQTVYTQPSSTTIVLQEDDDDDAAIAAGVIGFTAGIAIGAAIDNDYYYGPYGWGRGATCTTTRGTTGPTTARTPVKTGWIIARTSPTSGVNAHAMPSSSARTVSRPVARLDRTPRRLAISAPRRRRRPRQAREAAVRRLAATAAIAVEPPSNGPARGLTRFPGIRAAVRRRRQVSEVRRAEAAAGEEGVGDDDPTCASCLRERAVGGDRDGGGRCPGHAGGVAASV